MFILYILVGAIVCAAVVGLLYCIGWGLEKLFPHSPFFGDNMEEPVLRALMGLMGLMITGTAVMATYALGAGVIGLLFTGTGN
jgi:hypothetical protein